MYEDSEFEDVHTVDDWYDGPRTGFAQYHGTPHHYRSLYLDSDDWDADEDRFELIPVSAEVLADALEASAIFGRWDAALKRGEIVWTEDAPKSEFGALTEDRDRYAIVRAVIEQYATPGHPRGFIVRGRFELGCKRVQWRDDS
jgi:hypothetical protein